MYEAKITED